METSSKKTKTIFQIIAFAILMVFTFSGCNEKVVEKEVVVEKDSTVASSVSGRAFYKNLGLHDGIMVSLKKNDGSDKSIAQATTDSSGTYNFEGLEDGYYQLSATSPNSLEKVKSINFSVGRGTMAVIDIALTAAGSIEGTVTLNGQTSHRGTLIYLAGTGYSAHTDETGNFSMDGVPVGSYFLFASHAGFIPTSSGAEVVVSTAVTTITPITLDSAGSSSGIATLISTEPELPGSNCPSGGIKVNLGLDDVNTNGTLETNEIDSSQYICSGSSGQSDGTIANPTLLPFNTPVDTSVASYGKSFYTFTSTAFIDTLDIALTAAESDLKWDLYRDSSFDTLEGSCNNSTLNADEICRIDLSADTQYFLAVTEQSNMANFFTVQLMESGYTGGLTEKEMNYFSHDELVAMKSMTVAQSNASGDAELNNQEMIRAKVFYQIGVEKLSDNRFTPTQTEADASRFLFSLARIGAIGLNTRSDGDLADPIVDAGDILDELGCSETGREPPKTPTDPGMTCPETNTLPTAFDNGSEVQDILYTILQPEFEGAIATLSDITSDFNYLWQMPDPSGSAPIVEIDYSDAVTLASMLRAQLAGFLVQHSFVADLEPTYFEEVRATEYTNSWEQCRYAHPGGYINREGLCEYPVNEMVDYDITSDGYNAELYKQCRTLYPGGDIRDVLLKDNGITDESTCNATYNWAARWDWSNSGCYYEANACRYNTDYKTLEQITTQFPYLLTLRDSGTHSQQAQVLLNDAADSLTVAIDSLMAEINNSADDQSNDLFRLIEEDESVDTSIYQDWATCTSTYGSDAWIDWDGYCRYRYEYEWTQAMADEQKANLSLWKGTLTTPYSDNNDTSHDASDDITVDLNSFFTGIDLRSKLPAIRGDEFIGLWSDPSFGGFFTEIQGEPVVFNESNHVMNYDYDGDGTADNLQRDMFNLQGQWQLAYSVPQNYVSPNDCWVNDTSGDVTLMNIRWVDVENDFVMGNRLRIDGENRPFMMRGRTLTRNAVVESWCASPANPLEGHNIITTADISADNLTITGTSVDVTDSNTPVGSFIAAKLPIDQGGCPFVEVGSSYTDLGIINQYGGTCYSFVAQSSNPVTVTVNSNNVQLNFNVPGGSGGMAGIGTSASVTTETLMPGYIYQIYIGFAVTPSNSMYSHSLTLDLGP